jgi:hypothetical protein
MICPRQVLRRQVLSGAKDPQRKNVGDPSPLTRLRTCVAIIAVVWLPNVANACPVCFGGAGTNGKGMNAAIWFLLSVIGFVQIGFVALFFSFWRRAREMRRKRESFRLLEGGVR